MFAKHHVFTVENGQLVPVKYPCLLYTSRTGVLLHLGGHSAALDHAAVRRDVAPQDLQAAGLGLGVLDGADGLFVQDMGCLLYTSRCV